MYKWIRPSIIKYPTIWRTFTNKISLHRKEYWIQDITPEYRDQVIKFTLQSFLHDEPLTKLINVPYETRIQEFMNIWKEILNQRSSVICLTKDGNSNPILCGINYTVVLSKTDKDYSSVDTNFDRFLTTIKFIQENGKLFEKLNINEYLYSFGLYVLPEYRGDSIGENLLAARENMCKAFGLKATAAVFTSKFSQQSAERAGFQTLYTMSYHNFMEKLNIQTTNTEHYTSDIKFMCKSYNYCK